MSWNVHDVGRVYDDLAAITQEKDTGTAVEARVGLDGGELVRIYSEVGATVTDTTLLMAARADVDRESLREYAGCFGMGFIRGLCTGLILAQSNNEGEEE